MYVVCKDYPVMDGEPHLGSMTQCEEIWEKYEAEDLVIDHIFEEGGDYPYDGIFYAIDNYNDLDVPFNASDVLDWENLKVYLDSLLYAGGKLDKERMYAYAGVTSPKQREK